MDKLVNNKSIVGKSYEYWKYLYDKGIIESHAIDLRLINLKYAIDHSLITREEYYEHHKRIFNQFKPSCSIYKQYTLMDFGKSLKTHNSINELKFNQSLKNPKILDTEKCRAHVKTYENIQQNKTTVNNLNECKNKDLKSESENELPKKCRKKRKKKKRLNNYTNNNISYDYQNNMENEIIENVEFHKEIVNITKEVVVPKNSVKIFVRKNNKKYLTDTISTSSLISTKKSLRSIFSQILKKFKEERRLQYS